MRKRENEWWRVTVRDLRKKVLNDTSHNLNGTLEDWEDRELGRFDMFVGGSSQICTYARAQSSARNKALITR